MRRLDGVTLLCADTRAPALALRAMAKSMEAITFARALLLTDAGARIDLPAGVERIDIAPIATRDAYSQLMLKGLAPFVATPHALVVQWDGYVVNADAWDDAFLDCDYIGAPWSWQPPGRRVGNGGFSLRSRRLIDALADEHVRLAGNEDETIGVAFRPWLEGERGIRFADEPLAQRFSFEAAHPIGRPFGFHGLFNFARVVPDPELAALARGFDDEVARSPQCLALMRNAEALGRWSAVEAIAGRIAAADPAREEARAALARARDALARGAGVGRNDPCPCGSGKRYKACHGALASAAAPTATAEDLVRDGMAAHARGDLAVARRAYDAALVQAPDHPLAQPLPRRPRAAIGRDARGDRGARGGRARAARGAGLPRQPRARLRGGRPPRRRDRRATSRARARARARGRVEQPRTRAAGERPPRRSDRRLRRGAARRSGPRARALEPGHGAARARRSRRLAGLRGAPRDRRAGRPARVAGRAALGRQRTRGRDDPARRRAGLRRHDPGPALRVDARRAGRARDRARPSGAGAARRRRARRVRGRRAGRDAGLRRLGADDVAAGTAGHAPAGPRRAPAAVPACGPRARRRACARVSSRRGRGSRSDSPGPATRAMPTTGGAPVRSPRSHRCSRARTASSTRSSTSMARTRSRRRPAARALVLPPERGDFDGKAALIAALDLVVSVDTSVAHLAGALGAPVLVLLPRVPDWRWGDDGGVERLVSVRAARPPVAAPATGTASCARSARRSTRRRRRDDDDRPAGFAQRSLSLRQRQALQALPRQRRACADRGAAVAPRRRARRSGRAGARRAARGAPRDAAALVRATQRTPATSMRCACSPKRCARSIRRRSRAALGRACSPRRRATRRRCSSSASSRATTATIRSRIAHFEQALESGARPPGACSTTSGSRSRSAASTPRAQACYEQRARRDAGRPQRDRQPRAEPLPAAALQGGDPVVRSRDRADADGAGGDLGEPRRVQRL